MQYARCKCGKSEFHTSMGLWPCLWCEECKTTLAFGPAGHSSERKPHSMYTTETEVQGDDETVKVKKSYCRWCHNTKKELEAKGEPMVFE